MKLKFRVTKKGKSPLVLSKDIHKEIPIIVSDDLEYIREALYTAAPSMNRTHDERKSHVQPRGRKHLKEYLNQRSNCKHRISPYSGYVFFDEKLVPHIKFVIEAIAEHRIPKQGSKLMKFWSLKTNDWAFATSVKHRGSPSNNFIDDVFVQSFGHIINTFIEKMRRALKR